MSDNSKTSTKPVTGPSLRPSDFVTEQPDLSKYTLDEVLSRFKETEKRRGLNTEPENEAEVRLHVHSAPRELISSIRVVAAHFGVSQSVLTKCMSRHLADWYANSLGMLQLASEYNEIYKLIKMQAYSTLRLQAENPAKFSLLSPADHTSTGVSTIRWVVARVRDANDVVHIDVMNLIMIGFMWSLTTIEHPEWDANAIKRFFVPEVYNFDAFVAERRIDVQSLQAKYKYREDINYNDHIYIREPMVSYDKVV
jgi:hypothetical protein